MEEEYERFLAFDWSHEGWQTYLNNLYPAPNQRQILRFKKKWYKKNVNSDFDDTYEPQTAAQSTSTSSSATFSAPSVRSAPLPAFTNSSYHDGTRWAIMGKKSQICFVAYAASLTMAVGSFAFVFPPYQALLVLVSSMLLEILAKYGLKFKTEYLHNVLLDDVGVMPIMALTLLTPGLHPLIRTMALIPSFLTALLSFAQICKNYTRLPVWLSEFFAPLAEPKARYQVMKARAQVEVGLGFILIVGIFVALAAPFSAVLFWNSMIMRYMMSAWTQAAFKGIDDLLQPVLGKIPGIKQAYAAIKRNLYSLVDPESRKAGRLCTIL